MNSRAEQIAVNAQAAERLSVAGSIARRICSSRQHQQGFTLTELITVIVLVGILSAVALPRFFDNNVFQSRGFADQVLSTLRYAQKAAVAQRRFVCATFAANSVTLTHGPASNCAGGGLTGPDGATPYAVANAGIAIPPPAAGNISFDCLGRPRSVGDAAATCAPGNVVGVLDADQVVTVAGAPAITIERETGYVHQ